MHLCERKVWKEVMQKTPKYDLPWLRRHQWGFLQEEEGDIIRHDGQHVDDVHPIDQEVNLVVDVSLVVMTGKSEELVVWEGRVWCHQAEMEVGSGVAVGGGGEDGGDGGGKV